MTSDEVLKTDALYLHGKLYYKKQEDKYLTYCCKCRTYHEYPKKIFKQIQAAAICPNCFQEIKPSKKEEDWFCFYLLDQQTDGYRVAVSYRISEEPKAKIDQVLRLKWSKKGDIEVRYIQANMGYSLIYMPDRDEWKPRRSQGYLYRFYSTQGYWEEKAISTKREYIYKALGDQGILDFEADKLAKSNQRKIFKDYLLNGRQMTFVMAFDLKSYDEVYKYRGYMHDNTPDVYRPLNVHYLDYLWRNNIKLSDFRDYERQCAKLGIKLNKPKDFNDAHWKLSKIIQEEKDKENDIKINLRYAELQEKAFEKGKIQISPFRNGEQIRDCANKLHNCIAAIYLKRYAEEQTDLYYLTDRKKLMIAIEVKKGKLIQAKAEWNQDCPNKYKKYINEWCKMNRFEVNI